MFIHELGHAFGLGEEGSLCDYNDYKFSHLSEVKSPSIMDGNFDFIFLTCDDVEGILFLFDRASKHIRKKFKSICPFRNGYYIDNKPQGLWTYYNSYDYYNKNIKNLEYKIFYENDANAYLKEYYENRLISEGNFLKGIKNGTFKYYFYEKLISETQYKKGFKNGVEVYYGINGKTRYRKWNMGELIN